MVESRGKKKPVAAFITLGCKLNRYDSGVLISMLPEGGYEIIDDAAERGGAVHADIYIINTCSVTGKSAFQSRQMVRRARRWNPEARIIATGCAAELSRGELLAAGADLVLGMNERNALAELLGGEARPAEFFYDPEGGVQTRARAMVKIQDGCDYRCSFCVVPLARGPSRSLALSEVICQLQAVAKKGFQEAVLTGVHIGLYGKEFGSSLRELLARIEEEEVMPARIRLSSLDPRELSDELVETLMASRRICRHLHISLQSAAPQALRGMNRPPLPEDFEDKITRLYRAWPGMGLGLDVIAGFPGESETAHQATLDFIERLPVSYLHVFPFSPRPGTRAALLEGQLPPALIKRRAKELRALGERKRRQFQETKKGEVLEVVIEEIKRGLAAGTSSEFIKAEFPPRDEDRPGRLVLVKALEPGKGKTIKAERIELETPGSARVLKKAAPEASGKANQVS